jgi:hypothetical protein
LADLIIDLNSPSLQDQLLYIYGITATDDVESNSLVDSARELDSTFENHNHTDFFQGTVDAANDTISIAISDTATLMEITGDAPVTSITSSRSLESTTGEIVIYAPGGEVTFSVETSINTAILSIDFVDPNLAGDIVLVDAGELALSAEALSAIAHDMATTVPRLEAALIAMSANISSGDTDIDASVAIALADVLASGVQVDKSLIPLVAEATAAALGPEIELFMMYVNSCIAQLSVPLPNAPTSYTINPVVISGTVNANSVTLSVALAPINPNTMQAWASAADIDYYKFISTVYYDYRVKVADTLNFDVRR